MNLISNCCIAGDYYKVLKMEYDNPFIWDIMFANDIINLIKYFNTINWKNYKVVESDFSTKQRKCFKIVIDNKINVQFPHYLFGNNDKIINGNSNSIDVIWKDIEKYVSNTYERRLSRMLNKNIMPKFLILGDRKGYEFSNTDIESLKTLNTPFKICFISNRVENYESKQLKFIRYNSENHYESRIHNDIEIRKFLSL